MTRQSDNVFEDLKSDWRFVGIGAALAGMLGVVLYLLLFARIEAVAVVELGKVTGVAGFRQAVSAAHLVEKMQTPDFARRVAAELGEASLEKSLPAKRYGGQAKLGVRLVIDDTLLEIRARASSQAQALEIADAAARLAIEDDRAQLAPLQALVAERLQALADERQRSARLADALARAVDTVIGGGTFGATDSAVLVAAAEQSALEQGLSDQIWRLETDSTEPLSKQPALFIAPAPVRPLIRAWWMSGLAGLIGGAAAGYVLGMIFRRPVAPELA